MMTPAVPDRLRYDLKATAVASTNKMMSQPADGTDQYDGNPSSTLRFVVPHCTFAEFCDPTMSRFRIQFQLVVPNNSRETGLVNNFANDGRDIEAIFLDRGIESMIRRLEIFDTGGNRLESIDHYNCLYAITELCTNSPEVRKTRGRFAFECLTEKDYTYGTDVWPS